MLLWRKPQTAPNASACATHMHMSQPHTSAAPQNVHIMMPPEKDGLLTQDSFRARGNDKSSFVIPSRLNESTIWTLWWEPIEPLSGIHIVKDVPALAQHSYGAAAGALIVFTP